MSAIQVADQAIPRTVSTVCSRSFVVLVLAAGQCRAFANGTLDELELAVTTAVTSSVLRFTFEVVARKRLIPRPRLDGCAWRVRQADGDDSEGGEVGCVRSRFPVLPYATRLRYNGPDWWNQSRVNGEIQDCRTCDCAIRGEKSVSWGKWGESGGPDVQSRFVSLHHAHTHLAVTKEHTILWLWSHCGSTEGTTATRPSNGCSAPARNADSLHRDAAR